MKNKNQCRLISNLLNASVKNCSELSNGSQMLGHAVPLFSDAGLEPLHNVHEELGRAVAHTLNLLQSRFEEAV